MAKRTSLHAAATAFDLLLFVALERELAPLLRSVGVSSRLNAQKFSLLKLGTDDLSCGVAITGPGQSSALHAAQTVLAAHPTRLILSVGYAGGLVPSCAKLDLVVGTEIGSLKGMSLPMETQWASSLATLTRKACHQGRVLSQDRVVANAATKLQLGTQYSAIAVEMEGLAIAEAAAQQGVSCGVLRVISDASDESLPPEIGKVLEQPTLAGKLGSVAATLWRKPARWKDLWQLQNSASQASEVLSQALLALLKSAAFRQAVKAYPRAPAE